MEVSLKDYITDDFLFLGGSLDGQMKHGTMAKNAIVTLKTQEQYKFEEPNIMQFVGIKNEGVEILPIKLNWKQKLYQKVMQWIAM